MLFSSTRESLVRTIDADDMIKDLLIVTIFPGAMALAAASDLLTMTLPNRLAFALAVGFFVVAPLIGLGWSDIGLHLALALVALALTFALFSFGWIGGGDVKLFAATCLWLNPETIRYLRHVCRAIRRSSHAAAALVARLEASGAAVFSGVGGAAA